MSVIELSNENEIKKTMVTNRVLIFISVPLDDNLIYRRLVCSISYDTFLLPRDLRTALSGGFQGRAGQNHYTSNIRLLKSPL